MLAGHSVVSLCIVISALRYLLEWLARYLPDDLPALFPKRSPIFRRLVGPDQCGSRIEPDKAFFRAGQAVAVGQIKDKAAVVLPEQSLSSVPHLERSGVDERAFSRNDKVHDSNPKEIPRWIDDAT